MKRQDKRIFGMLVRIDLRARPVDISMRRDGRPLLTLSTQRNTT